jgi:two-component system nitrogen regulation sensor histidine kinase GlnL
MHGMAAVLAHEIKNPLAGIRGAAQLLEEALAPDEREMTQLIIAESDRIRGLIDRMESFGDTRAFARHPVNIHEVLDRVRKVADSSFGRGITVVENFDPSLPAVSGDRDQLIQVFLNLVRNAVDALPESGGEITLTTGYRPFGRAGIAAAGSDGARQWFGCAGGSAAAHFRSLCHHQAARLGPGAGACRQDRGRSWRRHRM